MAPHKAGGMRRHTMLLLIVAIGVLSVSHAAVQGVFLPIAVMIVLAFFQNIAFTLVSRARNRDNDNFHLIASLLSNGVWFLTFRYLIVDQSMGWELFIPYTVGTVLGSLSGAWISQRVEAALGMKKGEPAPLPAVQLTIEDNQLVAREKDGTTRRFVLFRTG